MNSSNTIYCLWPSDGYRQIVINDTTAVTIAKTLNRRSLASEWCTPVVHTVDVGDKKRLLPDIAILNTGGLAVSREFQDQIFGKVSQDIELLPMEVDGTSWSVVNCLSIAKGVDAESSQLMRSLDGEIYLILSIVLVGKRIENNALFTIDGSNHMQILSSAAFRDRVLSTKARGIRFDKIGFYTEA